MNDEERYFPELDPALLLPFVCQLEPEDPNVEHLPKQFQGTDKALYSGDNYA
jgi:hypothetical protein